MKPPIRTCAIYTRKSTEEGLDQDFNTLDAQREACLAYITSQKSEGWIAAEEAYDDGGFSGGNIARPALQKLLHDIKAGKIHIVVVYKIDRLTRSLTDFAKLVDVFDQQQVTFVSVTQSFNTTTSMGRLTLNVLLSFAQFEREVIGERTRDKIAASKKKGMWMGGTIPLGYDVVDRQLMINSAEAETVRFVFDQYLREGSVKRVQHLLKSHGIKSKRWTSKKGRTHGGMNFSTGALYLLLGNPLYAGMIRHKKAFYEGRHEPIIPREKWDRVQQFLAGNAGAARGSTHIKQSNLLTGKLFDTAGNPYTPTYTSKRGKRYRYYLNREIDGSQLKGEISRLPAHEIEKVIGRALRNELADKSRLADILQLDTDEHYQALNHIVGGIGSVTEEEIVQSMAKSVVVDIGQITIVLATNLFSAWLSERFKLAVPSVHEDQVYSFTIPYQSRRARRGAWVIRPESRQENFLDLPSQELTNLVRGVIWRDEYFTGTPASEIAKREGVDQSHVHRLIRRSLDIA